MSVVVSECECTYHHESEEEAAQRIAQVIAMRAAYAEQAAQDGDGDGDAPAGSDSGLHLV